MDVSVEAPSDLVEVSGGRLQGKKRSGRRLYALELEGHIPDQPLRRLPEHREVRALSDTYNWLTLDYYVFP
ncbi:MAG: M1 family peptidase, partial [Gemmatimonadaceae bacterium]